MLSNLFPPDVEGGAELLAGEIADGLVRWRHDVAVLTSASHIVTPNEQPPPHVRRALRLAGAARVDRSRPFWRQLGLPYRYYRRWRQPANALALRQAVAEFHPDVLYIWEITGLGVTSLLAALPALRLPTVFHLGSYSLLYAQSPETDQSQLRAPWLKRWLIGRVPVPAFTSCIAVSAAVREAYARAGFDPARIEVIHNGIAPCFFDESPVRAAVPGDGYAPRRLLFVGRLCAEKGVLTALKALALLVSNSGDRARGASDYRLDIMGDGDPAYLRLLRAYVSEQGLSERVTFHGRLPRERLVEFYDRSDLLLNTALWPEPFGLTTVEAMARGLPVIGTRVGGTAEIITPGVNGLLVAPGDEHALAAAILRLVAEPTLGARLAGAARQAALERFTLEENIRRVARHLERAISGDPTNISTDTAIQAETRMAPERTRRAVG
jgi:glycosyltransferase involved in cell wall biosynthesis